jgi:hypothetical protein
VQAPFRFGKTTKALNRKDREAIAKLAKKILLRFFFATFATSLASFAVKSF